jgi:transposase
LSKSLETRLDKLIRTGLEVAKTPPQEGALPPQPPWTLKRLVAWIKTHFHIDCCRETIRQALKKAGIFLEKSWQVIK